MVDTTTMVVEEGEDELVVVSRAIPEPDAARLLEPVEHDEATATNARTPTVASQILLGGPVPAMSGTF